MLGTLTGYQRLFGWRLKPFTSPDLQPDDCKRYARHFAYLSVVFSGGATVGHLYTIINLYLRQWRGVLFGGLGALLCWEGRYVSSRRGDGYSALWRSYAAEQLGLALRNTGDPRMSLEELLLERASASPPEEYIKIGAPQCITRLVERAARYGAKHFTRYCITFGDRLTELDLRHPAVVRELTDEQLQQILDACTSLQQIHLPYRWSVERFQKIHGQLSHLVELDFRPVAHLITDEQIAEIIDSKSRVDSINLAHCFLAGERTLAALQRCATLKSLDLTDWRGALPPEGWLAGRQLSRLVLQEWDAVAAGQLLSALQAEVQELELSWGCREALPYYLDRKGSITEKVHWSEEEPLPSRECPCFFPTDGEKLTHWHLPLEEIDNTQHLWDRVQAVRRRHGGLATDPDSADTPISKLPRRFSEDNLEDEEFLVSLRDKDLPARGVPTVPDWARTGLEALRLTGPCTTQEPATILRTLCGPCAHLADLEYDCSGQDPTKVWSALTQEVAGLTRLVVKGGNVAAPLLLGRSHINALARAHPNLQELQLSKTFRLTYESCNDLVDQLPKLTALTARVEGDDRKKFNPAKFENFEKLSITVPTKQLINLDLHCPRLRYNPWDQPQQRHPYWIRFREARDLLRGRWLQAGVDRVTLDIHSQEDITRSIEVLMRTPAARELRIINRPGSSELNWTPFVEAIPTGVEKVEIAEVVLGNLLETIHRGCPQVTSFAFPASDLAKIKVNFLFARPSPVSLLQPLGVNAQTFRVSPAIPFCKLDEQPVQPNPTWRRGQDL
jgi:hypothetical protein